MKTRLHTHATSLAVWVAITTSCQVSTPIAVLTQRAELKRQLVETKRELAEVSAVVSRYEKRYGKLLSKRPAHEFRELKEQLKGKPASAVVELLGKPDKVYSSANTESWDYANVAYDSASGRTVRTLEIWMKKGVVDYMRTSF